MMKDQLDALMIELHRAPSPLMMLVAMPQAAMMEAALKFEGRDVRRIKREMNKAWRRERRAEIARGVPKGGIDKASNSWWVTTPKPELHTILDL